MKMPSAVHANPGQQSTDVRMFFSSPAAHQRLKKRQGEDIEGVEYANRSVDGSKSRRSLESFLNDEDSASIQGPNFYRALANKNSLSPAQLPKGLEKSKKSQAPVSHSHIASTSFGRPCSIPSPYTWGENIREFKILFFLAALQSASSILAECSLA
jgi:hypothetical protein